MPELEPTPGQQDQIAAIKRYCERAAERDREASEYRYMAAEKLLEMLQGELEGNQAVAAKWIGWNRSSVWRAVKTYEHMVQEGMEPGEFQTAYKLIQKPSERAVALAQQSETNDEEQEEASSEQDEPEENETNGRAPGQPPLLDDDPWLYVQSSLEVATSRRVQNTNTPPLTLKRRKVLIRLCHKALVVLQERGLISSTPNDPNTHTHTRKANSRKCHYPLSALT